MTQFRTAFRTLRRTPMATLSVVFVLALGSGAATTAFALLDAALLTPLPYASPDRLVALFRVERGGTETRNPAPPADFLDWRSAEAFETMVASRVWTPTLTGAGEPARVHVLLSTAGLFELLGVQPQLGRTTGLDGSEIVIGHGFWQRRFGGSGDVIGREILLDGERSTVAAVMPAGFRFPPFWATDTEVWAQLQLTPAQAADRGASYLRVFARLGPDASLEAAESEMDAMATRLERTWPRTNEGVGINVEPLHDPAVAGSRRVLLLIAGAVGLLVLLTCANVGNVLLARALERRREVAVCVALGASRRDLVHQRLAEAFLLTGAGGVVGLLLALWALRLIAAFGPAGLMPASAPSVDAGVAAFAVLLALLTALAVGLLPALRMGRTAPADALRSRVPGHDEARLRDALVIGEMALASVLVAVAASTADALASLADRDPGFDRNVVATVVAIPGPRYGDADAQLRLIDAVRERLLGQPGIRAVGAANHVPVAGDLWRTGIDVEGIDRREGEDLSAAWRVVGGNWFGSIGTPLIRGMDFTLPPPSADRPVAIVNETFARRAFGSDDAVGRRIRFGAGERAGPWLEVVGVSADAAQSDPQSAVLPEVILPWAQNPAAWFREIGFVVRVDGPRAEAVPALLAEAVHEIDPGLAIDASRTMGAVLRDQLADRTFATATLAGFGAVALLLAAVGLYAIMLQTVRRRGHELAVRIALGASRGTVTRLVVGRALRLVAAGLGLGLPPAIATVVFASRFLPGEVEWARVLGVLAVALTAAAIAAAAGPAHQAARTPPFAALRGDGG